MLDRSTKLLLAVIALGLWANVISVWIGPVTVDAQTDFYLRQINNGIQSIERDVSDISDGFCLNSEIC